MSASIKIPGCCKGGTVKPKPKPKKTTPASEYLEAAKNVKRKR